MNNQTLAEFTRNFIRPRIADKMKALGFAPRNRSSLLYTKELQSCIYGISFDFEYYRPRIIDVSLSFHVSCNTVCNALTSIGFYEGRERDFHTTLHRNIGHIIGIGYHKYTIDKEKIPSQCISILSNIFNDLTTYGIPYLNRYSTDESILSLAYDPSNPAVLDFMHVHKQSLVAIILADNIGRRQIIPHIISYTWQHFSLDSYFDQFREPYRLFVERLGYGQHLPA
jgi:hypothetical protein